MNILVSTEQTQGQRENDFCFTHDGEPLRIHGFECDGEGIDGPCGCRRSFVGMQSQLATTTALVIKSPLSVHVLRKQVRKNLADGGWLKNTPTHKADAWVEAETEAITSTANRFREGTVLERRGAAVKPRV